MVEYGNKYRYKDCGGRSRDVIFSGFRYGYGLDVGLEVGGRAGTYHDLIKDIIVIPLSLCVNVKDNLNQLNGISWGG